MKEFEIFFTKQAKKDLSLLNPKLEKKLRKILLAVISKNPFIGKKLMGSLDGNYSYRLNIKDRLIYSVDKEKGKIYIKRAKTHYGD